jgi:hypothetical protein
VIYGKFTVFVIRYADFEKTVNQPSRVLFKVVARKAANRFAAAF